MSLIEGRPKLEEEGYSREANSNHDSRGTQSYFCKGALTQLCTSRNLPHKLSKEFFSPPDLGSDD
jgi:hypothetical protein